MVDNVLGSGIPKDCMYIVLYVSSDHELITKMRGALKKQYPSLAFSMRETRPNEFSIRLEGNAREDLPVAFCNGFAMAWLKLYNLDSADQESVLLEDQ